MWYASHGSDVAQSSSQAAVPDRVGRMPLAAEVHPFQAEVGGDQRFLPARERQDGAVVADALTGSYAATGNAANAANKQFFAEWHGDPYPGQSLASPI